MDIPNVCTYVRIIHIQEHINLHIVAIYIMCIFRLTVGSLSKNGATHNRTTNRMDDEMKETN